MPKEKKTPKLESWLIYKLRRISLQWPPKNQAKQLARVEGDFKLKKDGTPGKRRHIHYRCNVCKELFKDKEMDLDHIDPVIPKEGFDSWDGVITRLFCDVDGFQMICKSCHEKKTKSELGERVEKRKKNRKKS